jgi:hypothetical protein
MARSCAYLATMGFAAVTAVALAAGRGPVSISRSAADTCGVKVLRLQELAEKPQATPRTTTFSEAEINSYLALELSSKYHPSLKSFSVHFEPAKLTSRASIDFDKLLLTSRSVFARLFAKMLSGTHEIHVQGRLVANGGGQASFELEDARFDTTTLPNVLVEEIISAVGRKQTPPFDPMKPSRMPYGIDRVEMQAGQILVFQ